MDAVVDQRAAASQKWTNAMGAMGTGPIGTAAPAENFQRVLTGN